VPESTQRRSALEAVYKEGSFGTNHGLTLCERRPLTLFDIGGDATDTAFLTAAETALDVPLPLEPNTVISADTRRILWLSPSRWLAVDSASDFDVAPFPGGSVNNVSSGRTIIRLRGPKLRDVLAKGCPLDLHPKSFRFAQCRQSKFGSLNITLDHIDDQTFDIYIARGFARVLWEGLSEASEEYGYQVLPADPG